MRSTVLTVFLTLLATHAAAATYEENLPFIDVSSATYEENLPASSATYEENLPVYVQSATYEENLPLKVQEGEQPTMMFAIGAGPFEEVASAAGWLYRVELRGCESDKWVVDVDAPVDLTKGLAFTAPEGIWCYAVLYLEEEFTAVIDDGAEGVTRLIGGEIGMSLLDAEVVGDRLFLTEEIPGQLVLSSRVDFTP